MRYDRRPQPPPRHFILVLGRIAHLSLSPFAPRTLCGRDLKWTSGGLRAYRQRGRDEVRLQGVPQSHPAS